MGYIGPDSLLRQLSRLPIPLALAVVEILAGKLLMVRWDSLGVCSGLSKCRRKARASGCARALRGREAACQGRL